MEGYERKEGMDNDREEIYSKAVRAGKSKKRFDNDGNQNFEKHKIFLYKEDFEKFAEGLDEVVAYIQAAIGGEAPKAAYTDPQKEEFDVDFDQI